MGYYLEDHPNPTGPQQFGWPRSWASGVIGVHTTESGVVPSGADPGAENTARFISGRADYGSYHSLADWDSRIKLTRPSYAAWADTTNNVHALSVSGAMNAARWRDLSPERAAGIVRNMGIAAAELVQDAIAEGVLAAAPPAVRITAAEAIAGSRPGFYGHGETNPGTRYDPGQNFDWDLFLATYAAAIGGGITYQGTTGQDDFLMALTDDQQLRLLAAADRINGVVPDPNAEILTTKHLPAIADAVLDDAVDLPGGGTTTPRTKAKYQKQEFNVLGAKIDALAGVVAALASAQSGVTISQEAILGQLDKSVKETLGRFTPAFVEQEEAK
jgi:hypothetical protein